MVPTVAELQKQYKTWTDEQLRDALVHAEDYLPEALTLIRCDLSRRKLAPVQESATVEFNGGIRIARSAVIFPTFCPKCSRPATEYLPVSCEKILGYYFYFSRTITRTIQIPFCARCKRRSRSASLAQMGSLLGIFLSVALLLCGLMEEFCCVAVILSCVVAAISPFSDPIRSVRLSSFDDQSVTFESRNGAWVADLLRLNREASARAN
jgi:hypothetical protein